MVGEQPAPLRLPLKTSAETLWKIRAVEPQAPQFVRISEGQKRLLAGEVTFSTRTLQTAGLPLPMLRPESALLLELEPVKA